MECTIENCLLCQDNDETFCDLCQQGYVLAENNTLCTNCAAENCEICSEDDPSECVQCLEGFEYDSETMTCSIPECVAPLIFILGEGCACPDGQLEDAGKCLDCPANCEECSSAAICDKCSIGYFINIDDGCDQCMDNCLECVSSTTCDRCQEGFYFDGEQCLERPA